MFTYTQAALLCFAAAVLFQVVAGFLLRCANLRPLYLPALVDFAWDEVAPGVKPQPYPQLFVFRTEICRLWLLIISPLYSLALAVFVLLRLDVRWAGTFEWDVFPGPFLGCFVGMLTGLAVLSGWFWASERWLLRRGIARLGVVHAQLADNRRTYEYCDLQGERRGGTAAVYGQVTSPVTPVFVDSHVPDRSKPGFGFLFHRFVVVDSKHLSNQELELSQENQQPRLGSSVLQQLTSV